MEQDNVKEDKRGPVKEVDPYEIDSDIVRKALQKGWVPPDPESLLRRLHDVLGVLSPNWNGPLEVVADLIPYENEVEAARKLIAYTDPTSVYQFLADVYLTDELEED